MSDALVLVDIQNEYFKGGKMELHRPEQAAENAARALGYFRVAGLPVFHVRHVSERPGASAFLPGSAGADIHPSVAPLEGETVVVKHRPSSFLGTDLADELRRLDVEHIVVCGMMSHMCIDTTVRSAQEHGFAATVLEDACTTMDLSWQGAALPAETVHGVIMTSLNGMFARVLPTGDYLAERQST